MSENYRKIIAVSWKIPEHNEFLFADNNKKANFCLFSLSHFSESDPIQSLSFCISCFFLLNVKQHFCCHKYFWWSHHFCYVILKEMEIQKIFWTGNEVILCHDSLCCDAIIRPSCQYCGNAVNIRVGIPITM